MDRARKWIGATAAIVAVSASTSAFAQTKTTTDNQDATTTTGTKKAKTQTVRADDAKKAKEQQEQMERARASQTTVTSAEATPPSAPPPGAEKRGVEINWPIMIASAGLLAATYIPTAVVGFTGRGDTRTLIVPVVGPWISLGARNCNLEPCDAEALDTTLMITSGILQGVGAIGVALSVFIPPPSRGSVPGIAQGPTVHVTPVSFGRSGAGIGAVGTF